MRARTLVNIVIAIAGHLPRSSKAARLSLICAIALLPMYLEAAEALSPAAQRGLVFARTNCARCHSISRTGESPLKIAPPFRTLHLKYPVETLEEALGEGIVTGHPTMPEFRLDPDQVGNLISYLKSLER